MQNLEQLIGTIRPLDRAAMDAAARRQAQLAKPPGSLGRLEELSIQLAGITGQLHNDLAKKQLLVFAADNGVVAEGVASTPQIVTLQQTINLTRCKTGAAVLAARFGCGVTVCDMGVKIPVNDPAVLDRRIAAGTGNIAAGPAMTRAQAEQAILTGAQIAMEADAALLGIGEMGIGNTTTTSAVACVLLNKPVTEMTGRGAGLSKEGLQRKIRAIEAALSKNQPDPNDPLDIISKVGGFDIAGICGVFLGGAIYHVPVLADGFISTIAALCAVRMCPKAEKAIFASHVSAEPAGRMVLEALHRQPLITAGMRLGEGTGAVAAMPLLDMACAVYQESYTFEQGGIEHYVPYGDS